LFSIQNHVFLAVLCHQFSYLILLFSVPSSGLWLPGSTSLHTGKFIVLQELFKLLWIINANGEGYTVT